MRWTQTGLMLTRAALAAGCSPQSSAVAAAISAPGRWLVQSWDWAGH